MAQTRTPKGTAAAKASGTTLTVPDVSMVGGDSLAVVVAWDTSITDNPTVEFGSNELNFLVGETMNAKWRIRFYAELIRNTRTKDVVATFPTANPARLMIVSALHEAAGNLYNDSNENAATTVSTAGPNTPIDHISTLLLAFHLSNGPLGDNTGSSSTGCTLGQRVGTTGDADTTNITVQERFKIITASTVAAGSFVVDDSYQIKTLGTTDFTAIGAASNTIGVQFVATGAGAGTGDAFYLEDGRSRVTGLTVRDHEAVIGFMRPRQTFTIKRMVQNHRNMNHNPDWVEVLVEDEAGRGFRFSIDPDHFDAWSDAAVAEYISKIASIWTVNNIDSNLVYEADSTRDARMATFVDDQVIL